MRKKIFVVIPVYNEGNIVLDVIKKIPSFISQIIIVDDCSTDETTEIIENFLDVPDCDSSKITLLKLEYNRGVGGATIEGFKKGISLGGEVLIKMDGDNQMDSRYLPNLLAPIILSNYDMTKGNRLYGLEGIREMPPLRIIGNIILSLLTKVVSGQWHIKDPQNGYIAICSQAFRKINIIRLNNRFSFENSLLVEGKAAKLKIKDVQIPGRYNSSKSHIELSQFIIEMLKFMKKSFVYRIKKTYFL